MLMHSNVWMVWVGGTGWAQKEVPKKVPAEWEIAEFPTLAAAKDWVENGGGPKQGHIIHIDSVVSFHSKKVEKYSMTFSDVG